MRGKARGDTRPASGACEKNLRKEDVPEADSPQLSGGGWSPGHPASPSGRIPTPGNNENCGCLRSLAEPNVLPGGGALRQVNLIKMITQVLWGAQVQMGNMPPWA